MVGPLSVNVRLYHHIMPDSSDGHLFQRYSVTESSRPNASDHTLGVIATEQQGCYVQDDAVNEPASEKRRVQCAPAFNQKTSDPEPPELSAEGIERHPVIPARQHEDIDSVAAEQVDFPDGGFPRRDDECMGIL